VTTTTGVDTPTDMPTLMTPTMNSDEHMAESTIKVASLTIPRRRSGVVTPMPTMSRARRMFSRMAEVGR